MFVVLAILCAAASPADAQVVGEGTRWVGTWATALVSRAPGGAGAIRNQTLRQITHISLGGERVRVVVSNAFGTAPLQIGAAHVAIRDQEAQIVARSDRALSFGGRPQAAVAPGAVLMSDPVDLSVPPETDLAIDLFLPDDLTQSSSPLSTHASALQTNFVSTNGNHAGETDFPVASTTASSFFLARVEVAASPRASSVVAFGDSITDGTRSTPNTNNRWPDELGRRLVAAGVEVGVLNVGIAGNQVLANGAGMSALARFDRDALMQTGAKTVILLEAINDIGSGRASADDLIEGYRQLIARAHAMGLKIVGATLTPFEGAGTFNQTSETKRQAVNTFIRSGGEFDGVVDFDAAVRDPQRPTRILPRFNPGDNLHMNDAGYQAMGRAVDLQLFEDATAARP